MSVSPPRPTMPSLNALRAFEAAARLSSISAGAEELSVTPAAVAQHIKALEAWAGAKLLKRNAQGVELTPLGAGVLNEFTFAFDALGAAVQKLRAKAAPHEVRIATLPSIAQLWLSPRLPHIRSAMPDVSISVNALEQRPNMKREPFDLAIFYEPSNQKPSGKKISIAEDMIFAVCAPEIATRLKSVDDLADEVFLHDSTWKDDWAIWLAKAAPDQRLNKSGPEYSLYALALEECKNGAGILMGHGALVRPLIDNGALVAPFEMEVSLPRIMALETAKALVSGSVLAKVVDMLLSQ